MTCEHIDHLKIASSSLHHWAVFSRHGAVHVLVFSSCFLNSSFRSHTVPLDDHVCETFILNCPSVVEHKVPLYDHLYETFWSTERCRSQRHDRHEKRSQVRCALRIPRCTRDFYSTRAKNKTTRKSILSTNSIAQEPAHLTSEIGRRYDELERRLMEKHVKLGKHKRFKGESRF